MKVSYSCWVWGKDFILPKTAKASTAPAKNIDNFSGNQLSQWLISKRKPRTYTTGNQEERCLVV